jgi:hypothetical protein
MTIAHVERLRHLGLITKAEMRIAKFFVWYDKKHELIFLKHQTIACAPFVQVSISTVQRAIRKFVAQGWLEVARPATGAVTFLFYRLRELKMTDRKRENDRPIEEVEALREEREKKRSLALAAPDDYEREPVYEDRELSLDEQTEMKDRLRAERNKRKAPRPGRPSASDRALPAKGSRLFVDPVVSALECVEYSGGPGSVSLKGKVLAAAKKLWRDEYERQTGVCLPERFSAPGEFKKANSDMLSAEVPRRERRYLERWPGRECTSMALAIQWDKLHEVDEMAGLRLLPDIDDQM